MSFDDAQISEWVSRIVGVDTEVLYQVISHPDEAPTFEELYYFTDRSEEVVDQQVQEFIRLGILQRVGGEPFIGFTPRGKQFIVDSKVYRGSSVLKTVYQQTEMTEVVAEKFFLERPDEYLREVVQPEFSEREWIRNTDAWQSGLDDQRVATRLRVEEDAEQSGMMIVFEREKSPSEGGEWVEVLVEEYSYSMAEREVLADTRESFVMEATGVEYLKQQSSPESYVVEVTVYGSGEGIPSVGVQIENSERSIQPVLSVMTEPTLQV